MALAKCLRPSFSCGSISAFRRRLPKQNACDLYIHKTPESRSVQQIGQPFRKDSTCDGPILFTYVNHRYRRSIYPPTYRMLSARKTS